MRRSQPIATLPLFFSFALLASQTLASELTRPPRWVAGHERIRLHGIDCPEKRQAFGKRAKQFTSTLVFGNTVTVQVLDRDRYGRTVGVVLLPDGRSLNHELVRAGLAWMYRRYTNDQSLSDLEEEARVARRGLWADPHAVPPWEWRMVSQGQEQPPRF